MMYVKAAGSTKTKPSKQIKHFDGGGFFSLSLITSPPKKKSTNPNPTQPNPRKFHQRFYRKQQLLLMVKKSQTNTERMYPKTPVNPWGFQPTSPISNQLRCYSSQGSSSLWISSCFGFAVVAPLFRCCI